MLDKLIPWKRTSGELKTRDEQHPLARFRQEFDDLWDRFWSDSAWTTSGIDLDDTEKEFVVRADMPGFEPSEIDVRVSGNVLTLAAEHSEEQSDSNGGWQRRGRVHRSFTLPQGVLADQIDATYRNGVLEVHLPKSEECKPKRIAVKAK